MWIVRVALDRPYTFIVLALLILILSPLVILGTPTDIFPNINIPVVAVVWTYTGLNPEEMEGRITTRYERSLTTLVDNIQHIESTSYNGLGAGQDLSAAERQPRHRQRAGDRRRRRLMLRQMPPGTQPPEILNFSASSVPILQLGLSGPGHVGAGTQRPRPELPAHPAGHRAGRGDPLSVRRQAARDDDQSQSAAAAGKGTFARRRAERGRPSSTSSCRPARRRSRSSNTTCA